MKKTNKFLIIGVVLIGTAFLYITKQNNFLRRKELWEHLSQQKSRKQQKFL